MRQHPPPPPAPAAESEGRLPLRGWALELARRWNAGTYSMFVLHGNIFDVFPVQEGGQTVFVPLKTFLARRLFPERSFLMFYDIADGLTFGSPEAQRRFFEWLEVYDSVENTTFHITGPPREFARLAPLLRRFFLKAADEPDKWRGVTLIVDFPEKLIPASEEAGASTEERVNLVTFLKWASGPEFARLDVGVILVCESASDLKADLLRNPHVAQVRLDLPDAEERRRLLESAWPERMAGGRPLSAWCDFSAADLAARTAGLNLLRIQHLLAEAARNGARVTHEHLSAGKKRLIEEFCQGLVRFKDPRPG